MASQERIFFKSLTMPGSKDVALDAERIRELMDLTVSFSEENIIGISISCAFNNNIEKGDLE
jgi:hypothetical protein